MGLAYSQIDQEYDCDHSGGVQNFNLSGRHPRLLFEESSFNDLLRLLYDFISVKGGSKGYSGAPMLQQRFRFSVNATTLALRAAVAWRGNDTGSGYRSWIGFSGVSKAGKDIPAKTSLEILDFPTMMGAQVLEADFNSMVLLSRTIPGLSAAVRQVI